MYTVIQSNGDEADEHVYSHTSDTNHRSMFIGQTKVQGNWYVPGYINSGYRFCDMTLKFFLFPCQTYSFAIDLLMNWLNSWINGI